LAAEDLIIGFIAGACGSLLLWVTIGRRMMLKYAGESVINAIISPSDDTNKALDSVFSRFWETLNRPAIDIDTTNEKGDKITIKISPLQSIMAAMIDEIVSRVWTKIRGSSGAVKAEANRMEAGLAALSGFPLPRKGQSTGEFVLEQMASRLMPILEEKLSKKMTDISTGSGSGKDGW